MSTSHLLLLLLAAAEKCTRVHFEIDLIYQIWLDSAWNQKWPVVWIKYYPNDRPTGQNIYILFLEQNSILRCCCLLLLGCLRGTRASPSVRDPLA